MRDFDIRRELHENYLQNFYQDGESRVVDELPVCNGQSIIDVAVVNGSLHGYEIKSKYDTLNRLPGQIESYGKVFDYLTIIVGENHLDHAIKLLPEWWGIWVMSEKEGAVHRIEYRPAQKNQGKDGFSIAQLLWRDEMIELLTKEGLDKGFRTKRKWILWDRAAQSIELETLSKYARTYLKRRENWKADSA